MARRKRASAEQPIGVGLTAKQMKRKKPLSAEYLVDIEPLTENQKRLLLHIKSKNILLPMDVLVLVRPLLHSIMLFKMF